MSGHRGSELAKALYERGKSDREVRDRLVDEGLPVRVAANAMWFARRLLQRRPDGSIKTGGLRNKGVDWTYVESVVRPAEAAFLAALRASERPPRNLRFDEQSVPLRIGAFGG